MQLYLQIVNFLHPTYYASSISPKSFHHFGQPVQDKISGMIQNGASFQLKIIL